ncbi:YtxH domain-containing protein [Spirillospora albida]|uniref:YtxH domain-containing protein n=1 Tax=Spirillospora albida TaxID=58123 RepID=UPI00068CDC17|nr:YtxH domain-containing protein [Spirillospora albida]
MKHRSMFLAGAAIGYVFGTKAGRERYEQIKRVSRQMSENPNVQEAAEKLRNKGGEFAGVAKERAGGLASSAKQKMPEQMPGRHKADDQLAARRPSEEPIVRPG